LKIFNDFSRENHGHGGHEQGVRMGVFGGKLSFKKMSAGGRFCTLQENPHFWVPRIKVKPPVGTLHCIKVPRKPVILICGLFKMTCQVALTLSSQ
jgi:hypothetical protein